MWARKRNDFLAYYACLWVGGEPSGDISSGRFKPLSTRRREIKEERQRWRERKKAIMYRTWRREADKKAPNSVQSGDESVGIGLFLVSKICCYILPGIN